MNCTKSTMLLLATLAAWGCKEPPEAVGRYELVFQVSDDRAQALPAVPISVGETRIGETDDAGLLRAEVNAHDGDRYPLHTLCPAEYSLFESPEELVFLTTRGLGGEDNAKIEVRVVCKRRVQVAAILVHADGQEGLPVLVDGVEKGVTGPGGFANLRLEGKSSTQFELSLDTSSVPLLVPANPRHEMQLGSEDGLFVFEPVFSKVEAARPPKRKRRRHRKPAAVEAEPPARKRPIKID